VGLRELKKERTRDELAAAAVSLFIERGYDATTVEDIAAAIDVSPRTFFRYYPTKEDVGVELVRAGVADLCEELARRPADEPLNAALRACTRHWADLTDERATTLLQLSRVLPTAPLLRARLDEARRTGIAELTRQVGERLGVDPAEDRRPHLIATLVFSIIGSAIEHWGADGGVGALADRVEGGFDLLDCGIPAACAQWPTSPTSEPGE
jgi:AcrR family transcriptional regulator